jgi:PLP dependent protein
MESAAPGKVRRFRILCLPNPVASERHREQRMSVRDNVARVEERIDEACRRAGRHRDEVKLVAVSKTFPPDRIREAYEAGLRDFGENRVQEADVKISRLSDLNIIWHLIGHLQTNKAGRARELFHWVHSVDSARLARKLDEAPRGDGYRLPVLLQVNLAHEETKFGVSVEEAMTVAREVGQLSTLELRGLMLIPPYCENPQDARPFFRRLRELAHQIQMLALRNVLTSELSMGMSHDFEVAIEEGATMIRVGTAIFGRR